MVTSTFVMVPLRGNLDTRLKKLHTESLDAIVLAAAGILRMGLSERITQVLDETVMLPAVGQGADVDQPPGHATPPVGIQQ